MIERVLSQRHNSIRASGTNPSYTPAPAGADGTALDPVVGKTPLFAEDDDGKPVLSKRCIGIIVATVAAVLLAIIVIGVVAAGGKKKRGELTNDNSSPSFGANDPSFPELPPLGPIGSPGTAAAPPPKLALTGYAKALDLAIQFYDVQKSGKLPKTNPLPWRGDTFVTDNIAGADLSGGYFDAGDGLKFTFPMAWSMTMIGWAISHYEKAFTMTGTLDHAREQLKWGTDWLLKTWLKTSIVTLVGDPEVDHLWCWMRPEDFPANLSRPAYSQPIERATDVVMEVTAALASASIVFKTVEPTYSAKLLTTAKEMYTAGIATKGRYAFPGCTDCTKQANKFYDSTIYQDEKQWASTWMYMATNDAAYLANALNQGYPQYDETLAYFSWDSKKFGARALLSMLTGNVYEANKATIDVFRTDLEKSFCMLPAKSPTAAPRTQGGSIYLQPWGPAQYAASTAFLADVYGEFLNSTGLSLSCGEMTVGAKELMAYAKSQVDYLLGTNPLKMSYMVGYGDKYPKQLHHRAASIPINATAAICYGAPEKRFYWGEVKAPNPNVALGAVSGGPMKDDTYDDERLMFTTGEPALSTNAPLLCALASMVAM